MQVRLAAEAGASTCSQDEVVEEFRTKFEEICKVLDSLMEGEQTSAYIGVGRSYCVGTGNFEEVRRRIATMAARSAQCLP